MQFNLVQLVPFCLVSFSWICSFQFVNKWIHSSVKQFDQGKAASRIDSFRYDHQLTKLAFATHYTNVFHQNIKRLSYTA